MKEDIYRIIVEKAEQQEERMSQIRRDLHRYPEMGWQEIRTSSLIAKSLTDLGYRVLTGEAVCKKEARMGVPSPQVLDQAYERALSQGALQPFAEAAAGGFTGVIGILDCGPGPVTALRFDIDALGVKEAEDAKHRPAEKGFSSANDGCMHACGHDGHTAMGLGCAQVLAQMREYISGTVKLIFQPAEEGVRGARAITEQGHLSDVDYVIGNHLGNREKQGVDVAFSTGRTMATTKLDIVFHGKAAHAGMAPEEGSNAMLAAATAVLNLHAIPRNGKGITRVNVGRLEAGAGRNVICSEARMELEVRGGDTACNEYMESYVKRIAEGAAMMHGCSCEVIRMGGAPSLESDPEMIRFCYDLCREKLGLHPAEPEDTVFASEDFSYMVNEAASHGGKGLFFHTCSECSAPLHNDRFDFCEKDLCTGVKVFCGMVLALCGEEKVYREFIDRTERE